MTYEEAAEAKVSAQEARREVEGHVVEWADFIKDHGDKSEYSGAVVLGWLGY